MIFFLLFCAALATLILGAAWLLASSLRGPHGYETPAQIGRRVGRETVDSYFQSDAFRKTMDDAIISELRKPEYRWFWFVKGIQARLCQADPKLSPKRSMEIAGRIYRDFLADNKIEFGAPGWDWSAAGAATVADECEIAYWEHAA